MYLDKNNLYGSILCQDLLQRVDIKWLDPAKINIDKYDDGSLKGCILEVDPEYPKELNELYNDYPLALDELEIKRDIVCLIIK